MEITPFTIAVPDEALEDLRDRLRRTRWPEPTTVTDWSQGVPLDYLRDLCRYWADEYDWRSREKRLNAIPQFSYEIDGLRIWFFHVRSPDPEALPLILTHGWPGSVAEFMKVIQPLAESFHLVIPSLPGYGFSGKPAEPGWGVERIARAWISLMSAAAPVPALGGQAVHRHPLLERAGDGRPFCGVGTAVIVRRRAALLLQPGPVTARAAGRSAGNPPGSARHHRGSGRCGRTRRPRHPGSRTGPWR